MTTLLEDLQKAMEAMESAIYGLRNKSVSPSDYSRDDDDGSEWCHYRLTIDKRTYAISDCLWRWNEKAWKQERSITVTHEKNTVSIAISHMLGEGHGNGPSDFSVIVNKKIIFTIKHLDFRFIRENQCDPAICTPIVEKMQQYAEELGMYKEEPPQRIAPAPPPEEQCTPKDLKILRGT